MSVFCIGLSQIGEKRFLQEYSAETFINFVSYAMDNDIYSFDSSPGYGRSEKLISMLPNSIKKNIFIRSKTLPGLTNINIPDQGASIKSQITESLQAMKVDCINKFLINKPDIYMLSDDVLMILENYYHDGKVGGVGIIVKELNSDIVKFIQDKSKIISEVNVLNNIFYCDDEVYISALKKIGIKVSSRSPLSDGIIPMIARMLDNDNDNDNDIAGAVVSQDIIMERYKYVKRLLSRVGEKRGITEFSMRYVTSNKCIDTIIIGSYNKSHIDRLILYKSKSMDTLEYNYVYNTMRLLRPSLTYPFQNN